MSRLSIVTPCFNEEEALPHLYEKLKQIRDHGVDGYELEFVFVNDGSSDRTAEVLAQAESELAPALVNVVTHEKNSGLGASLNTGFEAATGELVAALDCDCTYDPMYIPDMVAKLDDETDVLTGSEFHPDGHVEDLGPFRMLMSRGMSFLYQFTFQSKLWSFSCLLRIYRKHVLETVKIESNGFLSCTEVLIKAGLDEYRPGAFPHHLGHGFGLFPHEGPHLNARWDDVFEEGDVFTAEPGLYTDELRAGIRLEQNYVVTAGLERLEELVDQRVKMALRLTDALKDLPGIEVPEFDAGGRHVFWRYCVNVDHIAAGVTLDELNASLRDSGIFAGPRYIQKPAFECQVLRDRVTFGDSQWPYKGTGRDEVTEYLPENYPGCYEALSKILVMNWNEGITEEHVDYIIDAFRTAVPGS